MKVFSYLWSLQAFVYANISLAHFAETGGGFVTVAYAVGSLACVGCAVVWAKTPAEEQKQ